MFLFCENFMQYIWIVFKTLPNFSQIFPMSLPTHHFWVWSTHWSVAAIPGVTPLKKADSSSPSGNPMPITSHRGVGLHAPPPPLLHAGILCGLILCRSCACSHRCCNFMFAKALPCPEGITLIADINSLWPLQSFCPLVV